MTGRLSDDERRAAGLAGPCATIDPCVVVTIYPSAGMRATAEACRPILEALMRDAAPGDLAVCVHDPVSGDELPLTQLVTNLGLRLWSAWGANPLVRTARTSGVDAAARRAEAWSRAAWQLGAEVVEPNGERSGHGNSLDWVTDAPGDAELLPELARAVLAAVRCGAPGRLVSWTSHDHPRWHALPWGAILGVGGVDLHAPQLYAADTRDDAPETFRDARARVASASKQWAPLVAAGTVRPDLGPGGSGWTAYGQMHGLTAGAVASVLDGSTISRGWAIPSRSDAEGLRGVRALLRARAATGRAAGAIARWQAAHGLVADGDAGPLTLAALGV